VVIPDMQKITQPLGISRLVCGVSQVPKRVIMCYLNGTGQLNSPEGSWMRGWH
jgi:hypothetical protein